MIFEFDLTPDKGGTSDQLAVNPNRVLETPELLKKLSGEVVTLRSLLANIERAMCDMIDEKGIPIEGEVAESLQQLDLAVQTTGCLNDIMVAASESQTEFGHELGAALQRLPLKDIAKRLSE